MTAVVVAAPRRLAGTHRQHRLAAVERLDLGLLVHAQIRWHARAARRRDPRYRAPWPRSPGQGSVLVIDPGIQRLKLRGLQTYLYGRSFAGGSWPSAFLWLHSLHSVTISADRWPDHVRLSVVRHTGLHFARILCTVLAPAK
jgi:hypothetical protein